MWKTILRRFLIMIPEVIILSILVFLLAKAMPGDPFTGSINPKADPAQIHHLMKINGLYDLGTNSIGIGSFTCSTET